MTISALRAVFESALNTWATANSKTVVWENVLVDSPVADTHIRAALLPGTGRLLTVRGDAEYVGVWQMTIVTPENVGPGPADAIFDSLVGTFTTTSPLGTTPLVWLTSPLTRGPAIQGATSYQVPVSAAYWASAL